jgi:ribosomal protein S18 acetylase RimI-like enzyme
MVSIDGSSLTRLGHSAPETGNSWLDKPRVRYHWVMTNLEWLERISNSDVTATAQTRTVVNTPAFNLLLELHDDFPGINWATPLKADPSPFELDAMINAFCAHDRTPRLEFIGECWSGLPDLLESAGFKSEGDPQDIMIVTLETFRPVQADKVQTKFLEANDPDLVFASYLETQSKGFGYGSFEPATIDQISKLRDQTRLGRRAALGLLEGQAVGAGTMLGTDLCELQGVTTLAKARRCGVATTVSSTLISDAFSRDANTGLDSVPQAIWLSVEEDSARGCYTKIGFQTIGSRLNYSLN